MRRTVIGATLAVALLPVLSAGETGEGSLSASYREAAGRIIGAALVSDHGYETLGYLCDNHGHRLSGSDRLEAAIDWAAEAMKADGLANVREEEVMVPVWVRGAERAWLTAPARQELTILGLGGSVGTPPGGLDAEVVVVSSFEELEALGAEAVKGKAVLFDVPFTTYGETVKYRGGGASRAAKLGGVAALVRSVGPISYDTPHTGGMRYADDAPKVPTAAVTIENATMMHRMQDRGDTIRLHLEMAAETLADRPSANVVGEVLGSELPEEVVVVGGHIDSWDVGQGAQDDGAGCIIAWEAARLIHELGLKPRRTIRVVLFTNEENGTRGGKGYAERHADQLANHVAVIESDSGNGAADGFRVHAPPRRDGITAETKTPEDEAYVEELTARAVKVLEQISALLEPLDATNLVKGGSGADVGPSVDKGVLGLGLNHDTTEYFAIHHTIADTFEKIDKAELNRNIARMAVMTYVLADMPGRALPHSPPQPKSD